VQISKLLGRRDDAVLAEPGVEPEGTMSRQRHFNQEWYHYEDSHQSKTGSNTGAGLINILAGSFGNRPWPNKIQPGSSLFKLIHIRALLTEQ
jgi:hypothetical protein